MLIAYSQMKGASVEGSDEHLGTLRDLTFDGDNFVVRYATIDLGRWLPGREVPIRPMELCDCDWAAHSVHTKLDRKRLEESPIVESCLPITRQMEGELAQHYQWPVYWGTDPVYGALPTVGSGIATEERSKIEAKVEASNPNLRSAAELMRYHLHETDGEIGSVYDLIIDDELWVIRYIVIDMGNWLPGKKVMFAAEWITRISWAERLLYVDLTKEEVEHSPAYDSKSLVNRSMEERLYDYHGRQAYWE